LQSPATPSPKNGGITPSPKNGGITPSPKNGGITPSPKNGGITPSHIYMNTVIGVICTCQAAAPSAHASFRGL
jgi:hypothetical protein